MNTNPGRVILFVQEDATDNQPNLTGEVVLADGTKANVAMWYHTTAEGKPYYKGTAK